MCMNTKTPTHPRSSQPFGILDYHSPAYHPVHQMDPSAISAHSYFSHGPESDTLRRHTASSASVSSLGAGSSLSHSQNTSQPSPPTAATNSPGRDADLLRDLFWPSWPARLPTPELLQHLVGVFFSSLPHASRVLHRESFLASLSLLPTASGFPETSILHAICAVASLFTSAVVPPPTPSLHEHQDEIFHEKLRRLESRDDSFGEMQAKYAKEAQEESTRVGEGLFTGLQSVVILSWYYFYHARWVDLWLTSGEALRYCVPLGLNICEPQVPLIRSWKSPSTIIPPSRTPIEEETRRNTFWLAYAMDRAHASGTDFAMTLDDEDITQVMPCLSQDFARGEAVPTDQRQRLTSSRVFTAHIPEHTDSFVLYIKSMVLLSKVKIFNQRFKAKFQSTQGEIDPRDTSAFKGLDTVIASFISSFPEQYKDPISNGVVDSHLYVAHLIPHAATLLLHDPHADGGDRSRGKLSVAAHAILDLVYLICSTDYDITLLDPTIIWCWSTAAQELVHEMQHMRQTGQTTQVAVLRSEIEVIRLALVRLGERLPLGYCQAKVLDDLLMQEVPGCTMDSALYNSHFMEDVDPGSLEQLMYDGMR
ncbi:fungal-specific transcription factor domain-containing protein [Gautieria morchelliformis]|nr:fungal-specific transcription factor domain-containing protein [Gautieria morchelliformis]